MENKSEYLEVPDLIGRRNRKRFDPDLSPEHPHNREAGKERGLHYDQHKEQWVDAGGCPMRDKFGQRL